MDFPELLRAVLAEYRLPLNGIHGAAHWARVYENGEALAKETGARVDVVRLFAVFHDSRRMNEARDPGHGQRGADFALSLLGTSFDLDEESFDLLYRACVGHTDGKTEEDVTVQTCWDSDRLDLGRVGIRPRPKRLCTPAARSTVILKWAFERSVEGYLPEEVLHSWGLDPLDLFESNNGVS